MNLKSRIFYMIRWYIRNLISACKILFRLRPEKKLIHLRMRDIWTKKVFDLADENYEWGIMKKSIEAEGLKDPIEVTRIRDLEKQINNIHYSHCQAMVDGKVFFILDGHHRAATLKHLSYSDPEAIVPVYIIEDDEEHVYFKAFYPTTEWTEDTNYGEIIAKWNSNSAGRNVSLKQWFRI